MVTLNPVKIPELTYFHTELHQEFSDILDEESLYSPDNWFPHVTIANRIEETNFLAVYDYCLKGILPFMTNLVGVALIQMDDNKIDNIFAKKLISC